MKAIKKFISHFRKSSFKKEREKERRRLFVAPKSESVFKRRKNIGGKIPDLFKYLHFSPYTLRYLYIGIWAFVILASLFAIYGPVFVVKQIEILRQEDITNLNIAYRSVEDIRWKSLFLVNSQDVAEKLKGYQKNIKEVGIKKLLPDTLRISIESYKAVFGVKMNEKTYLVTENGVLVPWKLSEDIMELKMIDKNEKKTGILDYKQVISPKILTNIRSVFEKLQTNLLTTKITEVYFFPKEREVHLTLENSTKLIFDLEGDIQDEVKKLLIFHKEQSDLKKVAFVYIDLRIKNKIFFCPLTSEFQCRVNLSKIYGY